MKLIAPMLELNPFQKQDDISLSAQVKRDDQGLIFTYQLIDTNNQIKWAPFTGLDRKNDLWKSTCFEAFFKLKSLNEYWELNVSPSGQWNLYRFQNYRNPQYPNLLCEKIENLKITSDSQEKKISVQIPYFNNKLRTESLDISLNAVLENAQSGLSYWALRHSEGRPDFHKSDNFILTLK